MEHLPRPKDCDPLEIKVPYLVTDAVIYDGLGFQSFPTRKGYSLSGSTLALSDLGQKPPDEAVTFVQAWLCFGLLKKSSDLSSSKMTFFGPTKHPQAAS